MTQPNRYPSPEPSSQQHPYHQNQQTIAPDIAQNIQPAPAPTAPMMQESTGDINPASNQYQFISQYMQPQPSTPQQLAQQSLDVNGSSTDPNKKRNKVSRACDECRRKKVRCDAESDTPGTQCSNCKRTHLTCQFSRQPQKRGPSKGYIKELADRVNRLEYSTGSPVAQYPIEQGDHVIDELPYSPPGLGTRNQRKRTHSMADETNYGLSAPDQLHECAKASAPTPNMAYSGAGGSTIQPPIHGLPAPSNDDLQGLPSELLQGYFSKLHPTVPLLPEDAQQLLSCLERSSSEVRHAFIAALTTAVDAATEALPASQLDHIASLFLASKSTHGSSSTVTDLVRLQTVILMALADEMSGPSSSRKSMWLGSAVSIANSLGLNKSPSDRAEIGGLMRRTWLSLVILDRWHSASICGSTQIPNEDVYLSESDHHLIGSSSYHLLRVSRALGQISNVFLRHSQDLKPQSLSGPSILGLMKERVETIAEGWEPLLTRLPLFHLALEHSKTFTALARASYQTSDMPVIEAVPRLVSLVNSQTPIFPPLEHHIIGLAAAVLSLATGVNSQTATQMLKDLRATSERRLVPAWKRPIIGFIDGRLGGMEVTTDGADGERGLQNLADAAVGSNTEKSAGRLPNCASIMEKGYLHLYGQVDALDRHKQ